VAPKVQARRVYAAKREKGQGGKLVTHATYKKHLTGKGGSVIAPFKLGKDTREKRGN